MFWSKLWLFLIAVAGALAIAVALLAPRPVERDLERETGARLERAQHAASLLLKVNARKWIDTAAQMSTDAVLVEALDQATKGPPDLALVHKTVQERLRYFNEKMKLDLMMATDAHGRVIARDGLDAAAYRDGVEGFPLVADALRGLRGDDTWSLGGKLYRVAASPVIARDRYVGALVVGQEVASELAQSMKRVLDVDVAFLLRGRVLAASAEAPLVAQLPLALDQRLGELGQNGQNTKTAPFALDDGNNGWLVVLAPMAGEAAEHKAAYALWLPRPASADLMALVSGLLATDPHTLPWRALAPVGGGLVLALLIGFLLLRLEAQRPLARLAREAQRLARGEIDRLGDQHRGKLGTVARALNTTLDRVATAPRGTPPRAFGFVPPPQPAVVPAADDDFEENGDTMQRARPSLSLAELERVAPRSFGDGGARDRSAAPTVPELRAINERTPSLPLEQRLAAGHGAPAHPPPTPPTMPATPPSADTEPSVVDFAGPDGNQSVTNKLDPRSPPSGARYVGATLDDDGFDDETAVASPSEALLRAARDGSGVGPSPLVAIDEAIEAELRAVYREFIETKQKCGEAVDGITYDKFAVKLRSNRQQLITRYACKTVRFQVYVKDGKAALKATPVSA